MGPACGSARFPMFGVPSATKHGEPGRSRHLKEQALICRLSAEFRPPYPNSGHQTVHEPRGTRSSVPFESNHLISHDKANYLCINPPTALSALGPVITPTVQHE